MARAVQNKCVSRKVFLKYQVNMYVVKHQVCGATQYLYCPNIWSADNPVEVLSKH